jgi:hypothetical protein
MRGTILDFLRLAAEKPELAKELVELATRHDFEFTDQVSDEELESVAGGYWPWPANISEYGFSSEELALTKGRADQPVRIAPLPEPEPDTDLTGTREPTL